MGSLCHKDSNLLWESLKPSTAPGLVLHTPCSSSLSDWVRQGWQLTLELQHLERRGRRVTTSLRLSWLKASQGCINRPFLKVSKGNKQKECIQVCYQADSIHRLLASCRFSWGLLISSRRKMLRFFKSRG